jgi:hypothetical protein
MRSHKFHLQRRQGPFWHSTSVNYQCLYTMYFQKVIRILFVAVKSGKLCSVPILARKIRKFYLHFLHPILLRDEVLTKNIIQKH